MRGTLLVAHITTCISLSAVPKPTLLTICQGHPLTSGKHFNLHTCCLNTESLKERNSGKDREMQCIFLALDTSVVIASIISFVFFFPHGKNITDNEIFGPCALCMLLSKMSPLGNPTHHQIINKMQQLSKHFSVEGGLAATPITRKGDRWPYLSAPASTAASGGNWEEGLWGLPCTLCPGEG